MHSGFCQEQAAPPSIYQSNMCCVMCEVDVTHCGKQYKVMYPNIEYIQIMPSVFTSTHINYQSMILKIYLMAADSI